MYSFSNKTNMLFTLSLILILFASSIKPTSMFIDGGARSYTYFTNIIAINSTKLLIISLILLSLIIILNIKKYSSIKKINLLIIIYILLKIWLFLVLIYYDIFDFDILLSILIIIITSIAILILKDFRFVAFTIIAFTCLFILINYYEIILNPINVFWKGRLFGTTNHPNFLGGYLSILFPFILYFLLISKNKILPFIFLFLLVVLLLLSGSRSSMLSLMIGFIFWSSIYRGFTFTFLSIIILSLLSYILIVNLEVFSYFGEFNSSRLISTNNTRVDVISGLIDVFYNNYLIGNPSIELPTSNSYLALLARGGIIAFIIFLFLISLIFYNIFNKSKKDLLSLTFATSTVSFLIYSTFEGVIVENFSLGQILFVINILYLGQKETYESR